MDINRIRAFYLISYDTPLNAENEDDLQAEIERKRSMVKIPTYEDALADPRLERRDYLAMPEVRRFLSLPQTRSEPTPKPKPTPRDSRYAMRRADWFLGAHGPIVKDGCTLSSHAYGHVFMGSDYDRIDFFGVRPGDALLTMGSQALGVGGMLRLPAVDDDSLSFSYKRGDWVDARAASFLDPKQCPYVYEMRLMMKALVELGMKPNEFSASLLLIAGKIENRKVGQHPALAQQMIGGALAMGLELESIHVLKFPAEDAALADGSFSPSEGTLTMKDHELVLLKQAKPLDLSELFERILHLDYATGYNYADAIPKDDLLVRRYLIPTAVGICGGNEGAFGEHVSKIRNVLRKPQGRARMGGLRKLYRSWHRTVPVISRP